MKAKQRIAFLMRYDYKKKSGGDVVQIKNYIRYFETAGYECSLLDQLAVCEVNKYDILFLVNIDRPIETVHYFDTIKKAGIERKVYIIPIHHPIDAISQFEIYKKGSVSKLLCRFLPDFYSREKVKNFARSIKYPAMLRLAFSQLLISYREKIRSMLAEVDGIVYISDLERLSVERDFHFQSANFCIAHNAVSLSNIPTEEVEPIFDVVVVGRVEPRKNQVTIAQVLGSLGLTTAFIGPKNENSPQYYEHFMSVLREYSSLNYLGSMPHEDVLRSIKKSKILLNCSYFEVNPLVDLEAAILGCGVVTTKFSYTRESLPNVTEIDPWDLSSISNGVLSTLKKPSETIKDSRINISWEASAQEILRLVSGD